MRNPDWLAEKLLGPEELALIQEHPLAATLIDRGAKPIFEELGTVAAMLVRTKFIDEALRQAMEDGARQYVILGAGFDTRAHRFAKQLREVMVFEVDTEATQARKRRRAEAALGPTPQNLTYVTIDFNRQKLADVLAGAGYDPALRTFFTWEGVTMYVGEGGVRETLQTIAQAAPGSRLVLDYATRAVLDFMAKSPDYGSSPFLARWGEPWVFGLPDGKEQEFFEELGFRVCRRFPVFGPESIKRYLTRPDGTVIGVPAPGAPPRLNPQRQNMASVLSESGSSYYSLAELAVPDRPNA